MLGLPQLAVVSCLRWWLCLHCNVLDGCPLVSPSLQLLWEDYRNSFHLALQDCQLTEYEAAVFVPCLIEKAGHNQVSW